MTVEIIDDLLAGAKAKQTRDGWTATRLAMVRGVTGSGSAKVFNAVMELFTAENITIGTPHPDIAGIEVDSIDPVAVTTSDINLRIEYAVPKREDSEELLIESGANSVQVQTNVDINGDLLEVEYPNAPPDEQIKVMLISVGRAHPIRTYTRRENFDPSDLADTYVDTVNANAIFGQPPKEWRCTSILGRSNDGGQTFETTYSFERKKNPFNPPWEETISWTDAATSTVPDDAFDFPESIRQYEVYEARDWSELNLE